MGKQHNRGMNFWTFCLTALLVPALLGPAACRQRPEETALPPAPEITEENADLVIALLTERNVFEQKSKYLPLQQYLSKRLDLKVYFKLLDNYEYIFTELLDRKVDGGFWGSMNGTIAQLRGGVEMLVRPVWHGRRERPWHHGRG